jgi:hypothetical protein
MGPQPVPHLIESKFLLYVLNGLLSSTAVVMQPLWLSGDIPKPQYPFKKGQGEEEQPNPLPVTLVPLPLRLQRSKKRQGANSCTGLLLGGAVSLQLPLFVSFTALQFSVWSGVRQ